VRGPLEQRQLGWIRLSVGQKPGVQDPSAGQREVRLHTVQEGPGRGHRALVATEHRALVEPKGLGQSVVLVVYLCHARQGSKTKNYPQENYFGGTGAGTRSTGT
jgi:hypothetical protein